jgi:hypothetical protein
MKKKSFLTLIPADRQVHGGVVEHVAVCPQLNPLLAQSLAADGSQRAVCQGHRAASVGNVHPRGHTGLHHVEARVCRRSHKVLASDSKCQGTPNDREGLVRLASLLRWRH